MKKIILCYFIYSLQLTNILAQSFTLYADKTFGTNSIDNFVNIIYTDNYQFILAGASSANVNGDKTEAKCDSTKNSEDIWILKIDTGFNILWDKSIGGDSSEEDVFLIKTHDSNQMIFSCISNSDSACEKTGHQYQIPGSSAMDYWICMIDSNGNKVWDKTLGANSNDDFPHIIQLSTDEFIVCGTSISGINGEKTVANYGGEDYWAIKLDNSGNKIWDKVYGGTGNEHGFQGNSTVFNLLACENGGFMLGGTTSSPVSGDISDFSRGMMDIWIIKCDSAGNKIWDKRYGGTGNDRCEKIIDTNDGGFMVCGETSSQQGFDVSQPPRGIGSDVWLIKLDSLGNKQWDKRYGGNRDDIGDWIERAPGGGYWVSGSTTSDSSGEVSEPTYGLEDYWIFKIDSVGNKLWDKRFGGPDNDAGSNFVIMPDSSIYLFGYADSGTSTVKTDAGKGLNDYWLVHFKYGYTFTGIEEEAGGYGQLTVSPNPAKEMVEIKIKSTTFNTQHFELYVYDITGQQLIHQQLNNSATQQLNISTLQSGIYIVEVRDKEGFAVRKKLVKD